MARDVSRIARRLGETFPDAAGHLDAAGLADIAREGAARMAGFGFARQASVFTLLAWALHFGPRFEARDPEGELGRRLVADGPEPERMEALAARMARIG